MKGGRYRKKPVVIEAILVGDVIDDMKFNLSSCPTWVLDGFTRAVFGFLMKDGRDVMLINVPGHGQVRAEPSDWLVRGVEGELYPCQPSIFDKTYEEVLG